MRIALVCDYALDRIGDAQAVVLREAELLRAAGDEVVVIGAAQPGSAPRPVPPGEAPILIAAAFVVPGVDMPAIRNTRGLRSRLRRLFRERSIDVVHVHSEFGLTAAATRVAQELGIPVVHTVHTFFWQGPDLRRFDRLAAAAVRGLSRVLRGRAPRTALPDTPRAVDAAVRSVTLDAAMEADAVISPSAHQAEALRIAGLPEVEVVPNPMPPRTTPGVPLPSVELPLQVLWVGRLTLESGILEFVRAVRKAGEDLAPGSLVARIAGDGPLFAEAREAAASTSPEGGSSIQFLGRVEPEGIQPLMRDSHLLAVTSFGLDPQPVVVAEAFRAARSVLYIDPRLREGLAEAGILCGSPDVKGMAAMLRELVHHPSIVVERSLRTVSASHPFQPEQHLRGVREAWDAAARRAADDGE